MSRGLSLSILFVLLLTSACSTVSDVAPSWITGEDEDAVEEVAPAPEDPEAEVIYEEGLEFIRAGRYQKAIERLQDIERLYPYSPLAIRSQVMTAYSEYKDLEYEAAISTINRFLRLNPGNKAASYMYYLKALCYYERISDIKRDQQITNESLEALREVVRRFPDSDYARDATLKIDLVYDHLAGKEMEIGRYYLKKKQFIAASRRFERVVKQYDTTSHIPEALYRLVESYLSIGVPEEARKYAAVLGNNYADSRWYQYAYRLIEEGEDAPVPTEERWLDRINPLNQELSLPGNSKVDKWFNEVFEWLE